MSDSRPVGVFDSGMGGLTVLAGLIEHLPDESFVYLGDLKNSPYGERPVPEIQQLVRNDVDLLKKYDIKALLVACNTASSVSLPFLRAENSFPVVGMEPAVALADKLGIGSCHVLATPATLSLPKFADLVVGHSGSIDIYPVPCPGLAGLIDTYAPEEDIKAYLLEHLPPSERPESIILGCTHYPLLTGILEELYPESSILSGTYGTIMQLKRRLTEEGLLSDPGKGSITLLSSDEKESSIVKMKEMLSSSIEKKVYINRIKTAGVIN